MNYEQDAEEILKELKTDNEEIKNKTIELLKICDKIKEKGTRYGELKYIEGREEEAKPLWEEVEKLFEELEKIGEDWMKLLESKGVKFKDIMNVAPKIRERYLIKIQTDEL